MCIHAYTCTHIRHVVIFIILILILLHLLIISLCANTPTYSLILLILTSILVHLLLYDRKYINLRAHFYLCGVSLYVQCIYMYNIHTFKCMREFTCIHQYIHPRTHTFTHTYKTLTHIHAHTQEYTQMNTTIQISPYYILKTCFNK